MNAVTEKARLAVAAATRAEHELCLAQVKLDTALIEAHHALDAMRRANVPDEPWAEHWRARLYIP